MQNATTSQNPTNRRAPKSPLRSRLMRGCKFGSHAFDQARTFWLVSSCRRLNSGTVEALRMDDSLIHDRSLWTMRKALWPKRHCSPRCSICYYMMTTTARDWDVSSSTLSKLRGGRRWTDWCRYMVLAHPCLSDRNASCHGGISSWSWLLIDVFVSASREEGRRKIQEVSRKMLVS